MVNKLFRVRGKKIKVLTDNTTAECVVKKHKSRDRAVNEEWKRIQSLLLEMHCDIVAERVTSANNDADELSRGIGRKWPREDAVVIHLPDDLVSVLVQVFQPLSTQRRH